MPSTSSLTSTEKSVIKRAALSGPGDKIHAAAICRVYYAYPDPAKWSYSGISGACVFGWGQGGGWLKVVDLAGTRGVIWQHGVVEDMPYYQDRTFFHTFPGDDCMIGLAFSSESEAGELFKKLSLRHKYAAKFSQSSSSAAKTFSSSGGKKKKGKGGIDKSMIGAPTNFNHVAHMGFSSEEGFSSRNIDPSWERLLTQLEGQGISRTQILKNEAFIRNFVEGSGGPSAALPASSSVPPPPPPPGRAPPPAAPTSAGKRVPPPAPPSRTPGGHSVKRKPPPPPSRVAAPSAPPAPPARGSAPPPPPPPPAPPARGGAVPPPPPPPPPARGGAPPPAPPPPPPGRPGAPPPPPPPPSAPPPAAGGQDSRGALLASIQGAGIGGLRKTDKSAIENAGSLASMGIAAGVVGAGGAAATAAAISAAPPAGGDSGGGDLASALAAALSQRKGNMGDSDEEGEDSEEDW